MCRRGTISTMGGKASVDYDALINAIYDAALDASLWPAVLEAAAAQFGASSASVFTPERAPGDGGFFFSHGIPTESLERYTARYHALDLWVQGHHARFADRSGGFLGDMLVPGRELLKSEFYADHLRPIGIHQLCTAATKSAPHSGDFISFAMFRGRCAPDFGEGERRLSERIAPHIQRAFLISARLRPSAEVPSEIEGHMLRVGRSAVVLVNSSTRILHATLAATKMLDEGEWLQCRFGQLRATTDNEEFARTIFEICSSGVQGPFSRILRLVSAPTGDPLHVLVARAGLQFPGKAFVVMGPAAHRTRHLGSRLAEVYGLTRAEMRLCERLGEGRTISEVAEMLSVQPTTVRSQLRSIFEKTGLNRQSDLTKAMVDLAAL